MDYFIVLVSLIISLIGCYFHSDFKKKKAIICWCISYPLSIYILLKALTNIFG